MKARDDRGRFAASAAEDVHDSLARLGRATVPEEIAALEAAARDDGVSAVEWVRGAVLLALVLAVARGGH